MTETVYTMTWGQSTLPNPSTITEDVNALGYAERAFDGTMVITTRQADHKQKWVAVWEGASLTERTTIKDAWKTNWATATAFRPLDMSGTINVVSPGNGYKEEKRYNHLKGVWRYKITLILEQV